MKVGGLRDARKLCILLLLTSLLCPIAVRFIPSDFHISASASPGPVVVTVSPVNNTAEPGEYFTINFNITDAVDLYQWSFELWWSVPMLLDIDEQNITEESFLKAGGTTIFSKAAYTLYGYYIVAACTLQGIPGPEFWKPHPQSGDGVLASATFKVKGPGSHALELREVSLQCWNFTSESLYEVTPSVVNGAFYTTTPYSKFTYSPDPVEAGNYGRPIVGETVTFNASESYDPDQPYKGQTGIGIDSYKWDFDDGDITTVSIPIITHVYEVNGTYKVGLTVTDDDGQSKSWERFVKINLHDIAVIGVIVTPTEVLPGGLVEINATVLNEGNFEQTLNVTVCVNDVPISTTLFTWYRWMPLPGDGGFWALQTSLKAGENGTTTISWDTTGFPGGVYTISVNASIIHPTTRESLVGLEEDLADNTYDYGTVTVSPALEPPVASFTYSPLEPLVGEEVTFTSTSTDPDGTIVSWEWDFNDDGVTDRTTEITTWTYDATGIGTVTLTVTDDDGLTDTETKSITIIKPPVADFFYSPTTPLAGETVAFIASDSKPNGGTIVSFAWNFGDGDTTSTPTSVISHVYANVGTYTVTLTITDSEGLTDTEIKSITIYARPVASFTYSPTAPKSGETINFDAAASDDPDGTIVSYSWNFGDGDTGTGETTTHAYTTDDIYTVTLTVTDNDGLTDTDQKTVTVSAVPVHDIAITNVTASPREVVIGNTVSIDVTVANEGNTDETFNVTVYYDSTSIDVQTDITLLAGEHTTLNFSWNTTGVDEGTYTIKAEASQVPDEIDTADNSFIDGTVTVSPVSKHDVAVTSVTAPAEVTEEDVVTINVDVANPGDFEETFNVSLTYDTTLIRTESITLTSKNSTTILFTWNTTGVTPDSYTVTAEAVLGTDIDLTNNNASTSITVNPKLGPPVASFTFSPTEPIVSQMVTFNASASYDPDGTIVSYFWDFGDEINDTGEIVEHAYAEFGTYTVTLTVTDNDTLTDTATANVTVSPTLKPPVASFTWSPLEPVVNDVVTFTSTSTDPDGTIESWEWDFNDDAIIDATTEIATWTYDAAGISTVTLTVTDNDGLTDSETKSITVSSLGFEPPVASFTYSPTEPQVGETASFYASASYDPDGTIVSYAWDFGDGATGTGVTATHVYTTAGAYTVTLTVTDNAKLTDTATRFITIGKLSSFMHACITPSPTTVMIGEGIIISGSIIPSRMGATVTIWYRMSGESWNILAVVITNEYGEYSYDWKYTTAGTYEFKARWDGDATHEAAESSTKSITVQEPPLPLSTIALVAGIVTVMVMAIVAVSWYLLKFRKPKAS